MPRKVLKIFPLTWTSPLHSSVFSYLMNVYVGGCLKMPQVLILTHFTHLHKLTFTPESPLSYEYYVKVMGLLVVTLKWLKNHLSSKHFPHLHKSATLPSLLLSYECCVKFIGLIEVALKWLKSYLSTKHFPYLHKLLSLLAAIFISWIYIKIMCLQFRDDSKQMPTECVQITKTKHQNITFYISHHGSTKGKVR